MLHTPLVDLYWGVTSFFRQRVGVDNRERISFSHFLSPEPDINLTKGF